MVQSNNYYHYCYYHYYYNYYYYHQHFLGSGVEAMRQPNMFQSELLSLDWNSSTQNE